MALCDAGKGCYSNEYKDFAFKNMTYINSATSVSIDDFNAWWAKEVATEFSLDETEVAACFTDADEYNTDANMRTLFKYTTAKGVHETPTAYVNGVKLDTVPMTVEDWLTLLNEIHDSQYGVVSAVEQLIAN